MPEPANGERRTDADDRATLVLGQKFASLLIGAGAAALYFVVVHSRSVFGRGSLSVCLFAAICISSLATWCVLGTRRATVDGLLSGVLASALLVAVPFSLPVVVPYALYSEGIRAITRDGLVLFVFIVPTLCAWIYASNATRAFKSAGRAPHRWPTFVIGLLLAPVAASSLYFCTVQCSDRALAALLSDDPDSAATWIDACAPLIGDCTLPDWNDAYELQSARNTPESLARAARISNAHESITGRALEGYSD